MEKFSSFEKNNEISEVELAPISTGKKIDLILLLLGRKEAAQLGNFQIPKSDYESKSLISEFRKEFQIIVELLDRLHLYYKIKQEPDETYSIIGFSILTSMNKETLDRFVEADRNKDDTTFGLMVGYPKTAVEAYKTSEAFDYETELSRAELDALKNEPALEPFLHFMPSRQHWAEELAFARNNRDLLTFTQLPS